MVIIVIVVAVLSVVIVVTVTRHSPSSFLGTQALFLNHFQVLRLPVLVLSFDQRVPYLLYVPILVHQHQQHLQMLVRNVVALYVKGLQVLVALAAQC